MIAEARRLGDRSDAPGPLRLGVTSGCRPLPSWKDGADFLLAQVSFDLPALLDWRASIDFAGPVYAGVLVVASAPMARKLSADVPELAVPNRIIAAVEKDADAGVEIACDLVVEIRQTGAFDGVHLIPVARYQQVAARLEELV